MVGLLSIASFLSLLCSPRFVAANNGNPPTNFSDVTFDWSSVSPSTSLHFHDCYEGFECARLEVPLDWHNTSNTNTVVLAIARLPAKVAVNDDKFGGTILLNPGGPSGSGVDSLRWAGKGLQEYVDGEKYFEMLSWDPRGTHFTTPPVACFDNDIDRQLFDFQYAAAGSIDSSDAAFEIRWAAAHGLGKLCEETKIGVYPDGSNIRQFVSTASVARDMVEIIDKVDEHLQQELESFTGGNKVQQPLGAATHKPLLNYWGHSYGTMLGNTFASMFPDRIGRMILDGVVDAVDYIETGWKTNLQDSEENWASLFKMCYDGGERCPLYKNFSFHKSAAQMQADTESFIEQVKKSPIPAVHNGTVRLINYNDLAHAIQMTQYFPNQLLPSLFQMLSDLMSGNTTSAIPYLFTLHPDRPFDSPTPPSTPQLSYRAPFNNGSSALPPNYVWGDEASATILCGDGDPITSTTKDEYKAYISLLQSQSPIAGSRWAEITLRCVHWPVSLRPRDANRFTGPFRTNLSSYSPGASPLLFVGNSLDNVTPLRNAYAMAKEHEGAVVLHQDSVGHCSSVSNPSTCTSEVMKKFFATGELPKEGTVCAGDHVPFEK